MTLLEQYKINSNHIYIYIYIIDMNAIVYKSIWLVILFIAMFIHVVDFYYYYF